MQVASGGLDERIHARGAHGGLYKQILKRGAHGGFPAERQVVVPVMRKDSGQIAQNAFCTELRNMPREKSSVHSAKSPSVPNSEACLEKKFGTQSKILFCTELHIALGIDTPALIKSDYWHICPSTIRAF